MPDGRIAIMRFLRASLVVAAGLLAATGRAAEPGTVSGLVRLEEGGPLRGVLVEAKGGSAHGATDADGRFLLEGVAPGTVEVTFRLPGFVSVVRRVEVRAGEDAVLEVAMPLSASASVVVTTKRSFRNLAEAASPGDLIGVSDSATEGAVTGAQIDDRPIWRPGDVLESVPGLVVSQHSGDGKANQYYLRGFNIDHGTDLATSIAGMPVNMPTHGHGQGYTDTSFLIPELVSGVQFRKGPYFADTGDFSNAGAVDILYVNSLERGIATAGVGENGYFRTLAADSPELGAGRLLWAAEYTGNDGPWVVPEDYRKWNGLLRYSVGDAGSGWAITAMGYDGSWDSTDQVPRRAVDAGSIDRFGTVDDTDGGESHRYSLSGEWQRSGEGNRTSASVYGIDYAMNLWSNFTYALDDPENGDQFEQEDRRRVYGAQGRHQWLTRLGAFDLESSAGLQVRHDDIRSVGLYHTRARQRLSATRQDSVGQTSASAFAETSVSWSPRFRTVLGLRADSYWFDVEALQPENSGRAQTARLSPKLSMIYRASDAIELYANAGAGFHSNDARGATITVDPSTGEPAERVTPIAPSRGAEAGLRALLVPGWQTTVSVWGLEIDSELVFIGDAGNTEAGRPSRRWGIEWTTYWKPVTDVTVDLDLAWSDAKFTDGDPAGDRIPGSIEAVVSGGIAWDATKDLTLALRGRYFGPRPLLEDDSVRSGSSTLFSLLARWDPLGSWPIQLELYNLLDAEVSDIDYYYESRLPGEAEGVADIHFHPAEPRTIRLSVAKRF